MKGVKSMAKLLGPDFISLQVRDFFRSRKFYSETLGLRVDPRFDIPDFFLFDTNSIPFAITQARVDPDEAPQPGWGVTLWIDCDQVDALHARLQAAETLILTPPYDSPFGRAMVLVDPDGYRLTANQHPWDRFPLGGVRLG